MMHVTASSISFYTLNPSPRIHARWLWTSSRHLSSDSELSYFKKHASLAFFVSGQAQQLQWHTKLDSICHGPSFDAHGFSPCGFSGFCFGSAGLYGQAGAEEGPGGVAGENQPVICVVAGQSTFGAKPERRDRLCPQTCLEILSVDGNKLRMRAYLPSGELRTFPDPSAASAGLPCRRSS